MSCALQTPNMKQKRDVICLQLEGWLLTGNSHVALQEDENMGFTATYSNSEHYAELSGQKDTKTPISIYASLINYAELGSAGYSCSPCYLRGQGRNTA